MSPRASTAALVDPWSQRVAQGDWETITAEVNEYGGALLPQLLTAAETAEFRAMYQNNELFRSTITMGRYRFGEGEYRYFQAPYPEPIEQLKQALYPRLLPIAQDWWTELGRPAPWPDTLDQRLAMCHEAGQVKSTAIPLKYGEQDWNAREGRKVGGGEPVVIAVEGNSLLRPQQAYEPDRFPAAGRSVRRPAGSRCPVRSRSLPHLMSYTGPSNLRARCRNVCRELSSYWFPTGLAGCALAAPNGAGFRLSAVFSQVPAALGLVAMPT